MLMYKRVTPENVSGLEQIYHILKACGEDMYENQGLVHWKSPYPIAAIRADAAEKEVYLVFDEEKPAATYQLLYEGNAVTLTKFAVRPEKAGFGTGSQVLRNIARQAAEKQIKRICIDVYDKSIKAIRFYEKNGFVKAGVAKTRRFNVIRMEKAV